MGSRVVGSKDFAVVVATALHGPNVIVRHFFDELQRARIASEEVLADVLARFGAVGLIVTIWRAVHQVDQRVVLVSGQQGVPLAAPDRLNDVPARAAETGFQLLNNLAVTAYRTVQALQVAVDHKGEVVQTGSGGQVQESA